MYSTLRVCSCALAFALAAMLSASAQSAQAVSVTYVDGEPQLWALGTALVLRHVDNASIELISVDARKALPRIVNYMSLRFATYQSDEVGSILEKLIWDQKQHTLKLSWTGEQSEPVIASFKVRGDDICAQVRSVEMGWRQHVARANELANRYCPDVQQQTLLMLTRLALRSEFLAEQP